MSLPGLGRVPTDPANFPATSEFAIDPKRITLGAQIGRGPHGRVYAGKLAVSRTFKLPVVIKLLPCMDTVPVGDWACQNICLQTGKTKRCAIIILIM